MMPSREYPRPIGATSPQVRRSLIMRSVAAASVFVLAGPVATPADAQAWPVRPIRMVTPFPPGGGTDFLARQFATQLSDALGQPVTVDNRAGAGGNVGAEITAKSPPDGYTLMLTSNSLVINASLYQKLGYSALTDITPVALVASAPLVLAVHPSVPLKSVKDVVAQARKRRGGLNFGSNGNGTSGHLAGELLRISSGIELTHVPYKGAAPVIAALLGGELDMAFTTLPSAIPHVRAGRLRVVAVTTPKSSPALPDAPPIAATFPGYSIEIWYGIFGPGGLPSAVQERLATELRKAHALPSVRGALEREGALPVLLTGAEFSGFYRSEIDKYAKIVKASGARAE
jgi:tripartite-type tricarboxylate transporter receptor subunit TctC